MFYDNYVALCKAKGVSPSKAAEEIGINKASVTNWKKNGYTPRADVLQRIAGYFDISVNSLLGIELLSNPPEDIESQKKTPAPEVGGGLSETARQIMDCVNQMSQKEQEAFLAWLQASQGRG